MLFVETLSHAAEEWLSRKMRSEATHASVRTGELSTIHDGDDEHTLSTPCGVDII